MMIHVIELWFFLCILCFFYGIANGGSPGYFNVKGFGARGDGVTDDSKAFMAAWQAACKCTGSSRLMIPKATYLIGPVKFHGPCRNAPSVTIHLKGTLKATDLGKFGPTDEWVEFGWVDRLTLIGDGTFDGQGAAAWPFNKCPTNVKCRLLPTSLKFVAMTNTVIKSITSLNSKYFHFGVVGCTNFQAYGIKISAPENSPNTDGIHIERCHGVTINSANIGTGDDCISIGHGNSDISVSGVTCGPGHGISVGSLGKYRYEEDVTGLHVRDCILSGTMFGVRIKTWSNSPTSTTASNMTFQNIIMNNVQNPIFIDQSYCPYINCAASVPSRVKLSDIHFRGIRGTSATPTAVTLSCSKGIPCQQIHLENIHLDYHGGGSIIAKSTCQNVKALYSGTQIPPPCQ